MITKHDPTSPSLPFAPHSSPFSRRDKNSFQRFIKHFLPAPSSPPLYGQETPPRALRLSSYLGPRQPPCRWEEWGRSAGAELPNMAAAALVGQGPRAVLARCCRAAGLAAYSSVPAGSTGEGQQREGEGGGRLSGCAWLAFASEVLCSCYSGAAVRCLSLF